MYSIQIFIIIQIISITLQNDILNFKLIENSPISTIIGNVKMKPGFEHGKYTIVATQDQQLPIDINELTGDLYLKTNIDREKYPVSIQFSVKCGYSLVRVQVDIIDLPISQNDEISVKLTTPEQVKSKKSDNLTIIYVMDDMKENQLIAYLNIIDFDMSNRNIDANLELKSMKLSDDMIFKYENELNKSVPSIQQKHSPVKLIKIKQNIYVMSLNQTLNFKIANYYEINVNIKRKTYLNVVLVIKPAQRLKPEFDRDLLTLQIDEAKHYTSYLSKINVCDFSSSTKVALRLVNSDGLFELRNYNELYLVKSMNATIMKYEFSVEAVNDANLKSQLRVLVLIRDVNDHKPEFNHASYNIKISKIDLLLRQIAFFYVYDTDSYETNSKYYTIKTQKNDMTEFKDVKCEKSFKFMYFKSVQHLKLIVSSEYTQIGVKCRVDLIYLSEFDDLIDQNLLNFDLGVSDYGSENYNYEKVNFHIEFLNQPRVNITNNQINETDMSHLSHSNIYKIDISNKTRFLNVEFYNGSDKSSYFKQLFEFEDGLVDKTEEIFLINRFIDDFNSNYVINKSKMVYLKNAKYSFIQFVIILCCLITSAFIFLICCIGLIIRKYVSFNKMSGSNELVKCFDKCDGETSSDTVKNEINSHFKQYVYNLNKHNQFETNEKIDFNHPNGIVREYLSDNSKPNYEYLQTIENEFLKNGKISASTSSHSSSLVDEGCYGSSDVSSERELKIICQNATSRQLKMTQQPPQNVFHKNGFSRFEQIYNSNLDTDLKPKADITSVSGSYV